MHGDVDAVVDHRHRNAASDAAAIERVLAGDVDAYEELVRRYQAALYRYAVGMVLDHDVAADMVQDAFVRAYTNLRQCRDREHFHSWLFQTLRNRCLDHLKDTRRKNVRLDDQAPILDPADGPSELFDRKELRSHIVCALADLPETQREAFVMHYVEDIPYHTMAELLDTKISALKMRVLRAREALSGALQRREVTESAPARLSIRRS